MTVGCLKQQKRRSQRREGDGLEGIVEGNDFSSNDATIKGLGLRLSADLLSPVKKGADLRFSWTIALLPICRPLLL